MDSIKFFLALILLVFSSQSFALFMPAEFSVKSDEVAAPIDGDC